MKLTNKQRTLSYTVFGIYLFLLTWLILFKLQIDIFNMPFKRNINLIPFAQPKLVNGRVDFSEMLYNIAVFVPFGVYISIFLRKLKPWQLALLPLALSLLYEVVQFIFAIGLSDITDVITNTAGGILGILGYMLLRRWLKDRTVTVINIAGLTAECVALLLMAVILVINF